MDPREACLLWSRARRSLERCGADVAVIDCGPIALNGTPWSGAALLGMVEHFAAMIDAAQSANSPETNEVVAILLSPSAAYVAAVLASNSLGLAFLPLDPRWPEQRLMRILETSGASAVLWAEQDGLAGGCGRPPGCLPVGCAAIELRAPTQQANAPSAPQTRKSKSRQGEAAYVMFTSGSTGTPVGVRGTARGGCRHSCCAPVQSLHYYMV